MVRVPAEVELLLARLREGGVACFPAGGALRDLLLGRPLRDFDAVVLEPLARAHAVLPEAIAIGGHTPLLLIELPGGPRVEITPLRDGARTLDEDLGLRDYTINALALDPASGELLDPTGGRADLDARLLRACRPETVYREDPVRILRGVRLAMELDLRFDEATLLAMERDHFRLAQAPGERLREELFRLLATERASEGIECLRRTGALSVLLPELLRLVGVGQNRRHPDDVYWHTLRVCARVPGDPLLRLAALLHDVAKPETKGFLGREGDASFHRHDLLARPWLERIAARLRLSKRDLRHVEGLVRHHLLFEERLASERAIRRMLRRVGNDILHDLLALRRADLGSRGGVPESWEACETRILALAAESLASVAGSIAIDGEDVMQVLGIAEGREIGRWLARARRRVNERPEENDREKLLGWLRETAGRA